MIQYELGRDKVKKAIKVEYSKFNEIPKGHAKNIITDGCIVIEGGAFRGLYNQGVLDCLMKHDINFQTVIGVSAGALAGVNYVAGQIGRSARANLGYRHNKDYVGLKAMRNSHSILRLDFLISDYNEIEPLDEKKFYDKKRKYIAVATNCNTGETMYFDRDKCNIMQAIKASASMPFISPMVDVDGIPCLDGGCSCKIAYKWALDNNYNKIVVIRTRDKKYRKKINNLNVAQKVYKKHLELAKKFDNSDKYYNICCDELDKLEKKGRVFVIAPQKEVTIGRLESNVEKLGELYWEGYRETESIIEDLKKYLME